MLPNRHQDLVADDDPGRAAAAAAAAAAAVATSISSATEHAFDQVRCTRTPARCESMGDEG